MVEEPKRHRKRRTLTISNRDINPQDDIGDELFIRLKRSDLIDRTGLPFVEFRKRLTPRWGTTWLNIAAAWIAIIGANALLISFAERSRLGIQILVVSIGAILIGLAIAYLHLFVHEAAHGNLHPDSKINDLLCDFFVGSLMGQDVRTYRLIHREHHQHLGTTMDTEITYMDPLNIRFMIEGLLGLRSVRRLLFRREILNKQGTAQIHRNTKPYAIVLGITMHLGYLLLLFWFHQWRATIAWVMGVLAFFPFFAALRQLLEHRSAQADPDVDYTVTRHGAVHRLFGDSFVSRVLGGAGFNRHLLHHWAPDIPCSRLPELEAYLMNTECAPYLQSKQTTYWKVFRSLFQPVWK